MNGNEISNVLLTGLGIVWFFKIWLHFKFLRLIDKNVRGSNLVSFFSNMENLFRVIEVIMPAFFRTKRGNDEVRERARRNVWIFTFLLWATFVVNSIYLYNLSH